MTIHAGKGAREGLIILYKKDSDNRIIELYKTRNKIEGAIMEFNKEHYQQAHNTEVCNDKICNHLKAHSIRDRILKGELIRYECDSQNVHEFLQLLKQLESMKGK